MRALGLLARLMPQLQVFFLAMPINILSGFVIMFAMLGAMITLFLNYYTTSMGASFEGIAAWREDQ